MARIRKAQLGEKEIWVDDAGNYRCYSLGHATSSPLLLRVLKLIVGNLRANCYVIDRLEARFQVHLSTRVLIVLTSIPSRIA